MQAGKVNVFSRQNCPGGGVTWLLAACSNVFVYVCVYQYILSSWSDTAVNKLLIVKQINQSLL